MENWLALTEYSSKYKVSISTLRRRIKADDINFKFDEGKYFILDQPSHHHQPTVQPRAHRPSLKCEAARGAEVSAPEELEKKVNKISQLSHDQMTIQNSSNEPILVAANKLLNELKRAYTLVLQEKEEQILELKSEVTDLRTLVRVLESELARCMSK